MNRYDALVYATRAHDGQRDLSNTEDYILHPIRVAEYLDPLGEEFVIVGLLHDVLEDCEHYVAQYPLDLPDQLMTSLLALTHKPGERYTDYIERVCLDRIASYVKLADLYHNTHGRPLIPGDPADKQAERRTKYAAATVRIHTAIGEQWQPDA